MKRPEVAQKVSLYMTKRMLSDENPMHDFKVRAKVSLKLMGHQVSKDIREKISKSLTGKLVGVKNPFYGKHHTPENKEKSRARAIKMMVDGVLSNRRTGIEIKM
ncbi:NUMOD3 domain-containing DNA-binding protein, partial [Staphylococcus aureus]|uniref:NUMOD3 domain-containing DNA-binding protein n=1 Tax=Staphylococcus aureus TaxID=1280 RepID=UPI0039BE836E